MNDSSSTNPAITYTRKRKTKTAASSTRRRNNIPLCHSVGGGAGNNAEVANGSDKSWFSRKASGWTDDEIRSHLVSGASKGGGSLSMEGDLIQGAINSSTGRNEKRRNDRNHTKRRSRPRFAWEEDDEEDGQSYSMPMNGQEKSIMRAAPTLQDIMDDQDQIDLLAPQKLGKDYQPSSGGGAADDVSNDDTRPNRRTNAALAEIAQFYENNDANTGAAVPTAATDSIGWRLLRALGYRSRLGLAFVSLPGFSAGYDDVDQANDLESTHLTKHLSAKHLASKGLRAIRLPTIAQNMDSNETAKAPDEHTSNQTLVIPPPKINKHGIGYDPFKDAPEFRAFHEQRKALAQKRGRAADKGDDSRSTAYYTDNLRRDDRQSLWDKNIGDNDKNESNTSDKQQDVQHMNYAAQNYTDFIGTKASSGFALEDEDDTNVYQDDEHDGDGFPTSSNNRSGYTLEIHSPVASEDEGDDNNDGLFHHSNASTSIRKPSDARKSRDGDRNIAGAWDAWGMGEGSVKAVTSDGKPPLTGFQLGQQKNNQNSIKRWAGPMMPSGYILKRHVFPADDSAKATSAYTVNAIGLGLDLQHRNIRRPSRQSVPTVLPYPEQNQQSQMRARDGTELNFNAVRESMKNRFVSSSNENVLSKKSDVEERSKDEEEWIDVTSTSWMPSRLLCKRWGISLPSIGETSSTNASTERVPTTGEEAYFKDTVLLKQKEDEGRGGRIVGAKGDNFMLEAVDGDFADPPPNRPSHDVFRSIFDASSDMDISSSEDDDGEEEVQDSGLEGAFISDMRAEITQEPVAARSGSSSPESEVSDQSRKRRHRREDRHRRKNKRRRRSPSDSPVDSNNSIRDECDNRRKKKKKRRSRHKEKRRR